MAQLYKIALWNANGLENHKQEVEVFLKHNRVDILLISETHFNSQTHFQIPDYKVYDTKHPDAENRARGGSAVIIRKHIKHFELPKYERDFLQASTIQIEDWYGPLAVSAVYCPPNYRHNKDGFKEYFTSLGNRFMAGGDYNAKHTHWGSRLSPPGRGRTLYQEATYLHMSQLIGQPTLQKFQTF